MGRRRDYKVTVCSGCLKACCWHGELYCENAKHAGLRVLNASELRELNKEHPDNYCREKLLEMTGLLPVFI